MYAVLFDIDGTLISTDGAGKLAFAETFAAEFGVTEISKNVSFAGRSDRAIAGELMEVHDIEPNERHWQRFRTTYLDRLPSVLASRQGRVLPGVVELLDELATMPHALVGLLTGNLREGARHKLTHYGLYGRFAVGGFGDTATDRNVIAAQAVAEARQHLAAYANGNGVAARELSGVAVIGDTQHDISCARSIGALAVAVPTGGATVEQLAAAKPDLLLRDLSESAEILAAVRDASALVANRSR